MIHANVRRPLVIRPGIGAGLVTFGMHRAAVADLLGEPGATDLNGFGEINEYRGDLRLAFDKREELVVEFGFTPESQVTLGGFSLFDMQDPIAHLRRLDPRPKILWGFVVFESLGITVTGFHDSDASQRAICLFAKGRFEQFWDDMLPCEP